MKKKKITIRGLQNQLALSQKAVSDLHNAVREGEQKDYALRKELSMILFAPRHEFSNRSVDTREWNVIMSAVARLTGEVTKEGEMSRWFNKNTELELERLWYLARVALRDPLLKVPVHHHTRLDIFGGHPDTGNKSSER